MSTAFGAGAPETGVLASSLLASDRSATGADKIRRFLPPPPMTQEQAGLGTGLIEDLFLRHVHLKKCNTLGALTESMALAYPIVERVFRDVRNQRLLEVSGMVGDDYVFSLTGAGRAVAAENCRVCQYAGPAPVNLEPTSRPSSIRDHR